MTPSLTISRVNLLALQESIRLSLEDIQQKHGHRADLIEPMTIHLENLSEARMVYNELEASYTRLIRRVKELELENLQLKQKLYYLEA